MWRHFLAVSIVLLIGFFLLPPTVEWWQLLLFLYAGVLTDFLWHSYNHNFRPWCWSTLWQSGWLPIAVVYIIVTDSTYPPTSPRIPVAAFFMGQAMWDLHLHAKTYHRNQKLFTESVWFSCASIVVIVLAIAAMRYRVEW